MSARHGDCPPVTAAWAANPSNEGMAADADSPVQIGHGNSCVAFVGVAGRPYRFATLIDVGTCAMLLPVLLSSSRTNQIRDRLAASQ